MPDAVDFYPLPRRHGVKALLIWSAVVLALALASRLFALDKPATVAWDEAHFGKFASFYIKREFYFDVHPPGGKSALGWAGHLAGYNGSYDFTSSERYPGWVPYTKMRAFCGSVSALGVLLTFWAALAMGCGIPAALLAAALVMLDTANIALGRLILLDGMLFTGTALIVFCLAMFVRAEQRPFSAAFVFWLFMTGVSIGLTSSVKWVGFFGTAFVGLYTIRDLYEMLGNRLVSMRRFAAHFAVRAALLIALPLAVYAATFAVHLAVLHKAGSGAGHLPSLYQAHLEGSKLAGQPRVVQYGSTVTLRNNGFAGGLLHSHVDRYPAGSEQQQVTAYTHHDLNNNWVVVRPAPTGGKGGNAARSAALDPVLNGDIITLRHEQTRANLHSHVVVPPITKGALEVSAYGNDDIGDTNDLWRVEIVDDWELSPPPRIVRALTTRFRLRHVNTGCLLWSHAVPLPEWGHKQSEVVCHKVNTTSANALWNIETHVNDLHPASAHIPPKPSFLSIFLHLNFAMNSANNALTPDPNKVDPLASRPSSWPLNREGLRLTAWDANQRIYLLGLPATWLGGTVALVLALAAMAARRVMVARWPDKVDVDGNNGGRSEAHERVQPGAAAPARQATPSIAGDALPWATYNFWASLLLVGWALHYAPFWLMGRVTYLHHYLPATLFTALVSAMTVERLGGKWTALPAIAVVVAMFWQFRWLPYGMDGPVENYAHLQWLPTWNIID